MILGASIFLLTALHCPYTWAKDGGDVEAERARVKLVEEELNLLKKLIKELRNEPEIIKILSSKTKTTKEKLKKVTGFIHEKHNANETRADKGEGGMTDKKELKHIEELLQKEYKQLRSTDACGVGCIVMIAMAAVYAFLMVVFFVTWLCFYNRTKTGRNINQNRKRSKDYYSDSHDSESEELYREVEDQSGDLDVDQSKREGEEN